MWYTWYKCFISWWAYSFCSPLPGRSGGQNKPRRSWPELHTASALLVLLIGKNHFQIGFYFQFYQISIPASVQGQPQGRPPNPNRRQEHFALDCADCAAVALDLPCTAGCDCDFVLALVFYASAPPNRVLKHCKNTNFVRCKKMATVVYCEEEFF